MKIFAHHAGTHQENYCEYSTIQGLMIMDEEGGCAFIMVQEAKRSREESEARVCLFLTVPKHVLGNEPIQSLQNTFERYY